MAVIIRKRRSMSANTPQHETDFVRRQHSTAQPLGLRGLPFLHPLTFPRTVPVFLFKACFNPDNRV